MGELSRVVGLETLARNKPALDRGEDEPPLLLRKSRKCIDVRRLHRIGGTLTKQKAVLPNDGVLLGRPVVAVVLAHETDHSRW